MSGSVEEFLDRFERATGEPRPDEAFAFADSPQLADELAELVLAGVKRATSGLLADHTTLGDPLPAVGDLALLLDGRGHPVCVLRTTAVDVRRFRHVDGDHAHAEGEDDRTLASWRTEHERFFRRRCQELGLDFTEDLEVVCERFVPVWPLRLAPATTIEGPVVRLRPFREDDLVELWPAINDLEGRRLTGTRRVFTRDEVVRWYTSRGQELDRLDLAVATVGDDRCVGEVVLGGLDEENRSCWFRIALTGPHRYGRGYGSEATRLALRHAFDTVGLHRVELEVYAFNDRARDVYERAGFRAEGVRRDALRWDGRWHDATLMAVLAHEWRAWISAPRPEGR